MTLAGVLNNNESALRASLQAEYGIRLLLDAGGRTEPGRTPRELADLVEHLPGGCALGRAIGGDAAITTEAHMTRAVEHTIRMTAWSEAGGKGKQPEPMRLPRAAGEVAAEQAVESAKASAWERRQARREAASDPS
ncbi:MAG: hypothetical protein BGN97_00225 [Microbacterium sp. 69-10]|uniref:hypothetical protein n=1 Tax=Microbacterium sp. 69-10 TaxID=1895783 RepID=UPI00095FB2E1|nr:hypothetical protein [Microbacterium sp. 69-10]OJU39681.1 MAG: hypothetical protein BGN97_00225 [Microbacterium sp. 69-10]